MNAATIFIILTLAGLLTMSWWWLLLIIPVSIISDIMKERRLKKIEDQLKRLTIKKDT